MKDFEVVGTPGSVGAPRGLDTSSSWSMCLLHRRPLSILIEYDKLP